VRFAKIGSLTQGVDMSLKDYMYFNKLTITEMALKLGIHYMYMSAIKSGRRKPSLKLASAIELLTGGQVSILEMRDE
jgi:DNA-binding XRE family transcriptional regulator